jgi:hypothetical protein
MLTDFYAWPAVLGKPLLHSLVPGGCGPPQRSASMPKAER